MSSSLKHLIYFSKSAYNPIRVYDVYLQKQACDTWLPDVLIFSLSTSGQLAN